MSSGWIKLHRQLLEWEWYDDINTKCLFLHCLLKANHKDKTWRGVKIKKGSFLTGREKLSSETGLTEQQIRTCLRKLKSTRDITTKSTSKGTVLTVENYSFYQNCENNQPAKQPRNAPEDNQQVTTTKNDKNDKNKDICQQVADSYNAILSELGKVIVLSEKRIAWINASIKQMKKTEHDFSQIETWEKYFYYVSNSDFLMGRVERSEWSANFDFLVNKNNLLKVVEGKYENN